MKYDLAAIGFFAVSLSTALAAISLVDRERTLDRAEEQTYSVARMMSAHAGAAIGEASARAEEIAPLVAGWDLVDPVGGRAIYDRLVAATVSPSIGAIGIMDMNGISRVNSWKFPSDQVDVSDREYVGLHQAGDDGPLLDGDSQPGPISRRIRFTYSEVVRDAENQQHAMIVVAIFADVFNVLYSEVATWPGARATLFSLDGEQLAAMEGQASVSNDYIQDLMVHARTVPDGSAIIDDGRVQRLVSWSRVDGAVPVVAATSQEIGEALSEWRQRSAVLAALVVILTAGFSGLLFTLRRARTAQQSAEYYRIAVSEVHHRVKNALQLTISMLNLRARNAKDSDTRALLDKLSGQLVAVAEIQDLLQHDTSLQEVDITRLMERLCRHLQETGAGGRVTFHTDPTPCTVETTRATHAAIVVNELMTNALKHAHNDIDLTLDCRGEEVVMTVADDGDGLPDGFDKDNQDGFGLRAIGMIAERIGGRIDFGNNASGGTRAVFRMPRHVATQNN